jgi:hypothetical protein
MTKHMTITKQKNDTLHVKFDESLPALSRLADGASVPAEYLHSILNYHVSNQDSDGNIADHKVQRMKAYW